MRSFSGLMSQSNPAAKYIILKGMGGLGNRLLALTQAVMYAHLSGRKLLVDWRDGMYGERGEDLFSKIFQSPLVGPLSELPDTDSVFPEQWKGRLHESYTQCSDAVEPNMRLHPQWQEHLLRTYSIDSERFDYPHTVVVLLSWGAEILKPSSPHFTRLPAPWFAGAKDERDALGKMLKNVFFLQPRYQEKVNAFITSHFRHPMVGAHIRYTDNRLFFPAYVRLPQFQQALQTLQRREPDAAVFLCTDSKTVERKMKNMFPGIVTYPKHFPKGFYRNLHYGKTVSKDQMLEEAIIDLYALASCDYVVGSDSSLSKIAFFLSACPSDHCIRLAPIPKSFLSRCATTWLDRGRELGRRALLLAVSLSKAWRRNKKY
jgi:hypothetical protein